MLCELVRSLPLSSTPATERKRHAPRSPVPVASVPQAPRQPRHLTRPVAWLRKRSSQPAHNGLKGNCHEPLESRLHLAGLASTTPPPLVMTGRFFFFLFFFWADHYIVK